QDTGIPWGASVLPMPSHAVTAAAAASTLSWVASSTYTSLRTRVLGLRMCRLVESKKCGASADSGRSCRSISATALCRVSIPEALKLALTSRVANRLIPGWEAKISRTSSWCRTVSGTATSSALKVTAIVHCLSVTEPTQWHAVVLVHPKYGRSEEHTSELQSRFDIVCRLLL